MKSLHPTLEILEQRIAPAAVFNYLNPDGGSVKITTSKGVDADLAGAITTVESGLGKIVQKIDLASHPVFRGTDLLVELTGLGTADIGTIDAQGIDLGSVTIPGDLGQIDAGNTALATPAIKSLHIGSLGVLTTTQGGTPSYESLLRGPLTTLEIDHNLAGTLLVQGTAATKITTAKIHGTVAGSVAAESGVLRVQGGIDTLVVDGDIWGGEGLHAGSITAGGLIRSATIIGNIVGCDGIGSGVLMTTGDILMLQIGGNVTGQDNQASLGENGQVRARKITTAIVTGVIDGGYFDFSGSIGTTQSIGTINAGGLVGGHGAESGVIGAHGAITTAVIGASGGSGIKIQGGDGLLSGSIHGISLGFVEVNGDVQGGTGKVSGGISSVGSTAKVLIHGKLTGGSLDNSGSVGSGGTIGTVEVQQGIFGGDGMLSGSVAASGKITTATIGVGLTGGRGPFSGTVGSFSNLGMVQIAGSIKGGEGDHSGAILCGSTATSIIVDGSVTGGDGPFSGRIEGRLLPKVNVGVDLAGNAGANSGTIFASGTMGVVDIAGSIIGFAGSPGGQPPLNNGQIFSQGTVASIHVGGDLEGGSNPGSGSVLSWGTIASIVVDGSLIGGGDALSGSIVTQKVDGRPIPSLTRVTIAGFVRGGVGESSGVVFSAGDIGTLSLPGTSTLLAGAPVAAGDVAGGAGDYSGSIHSRGSMKTIAIAGSLLGGGDGSGRIYSEANITKLTIGGSVTGGGYYGRSPDLLITPGQIVALKTLTSLEITGSIVGGPGESSAEINAGSIGSAIIRGDIYGGNGGFSGSLRAFSGDLTSLTVDGVIEAKGSEFQYISAQRNIGTITASKISGTGAPVLIMATGQTEPKTAAAALAIKSVTSLGPMGNTKILAGLAGPGNNLTLRNPEASIGTVEVGTGDQPNAYVDNDIAAGFMLDGTKKSLTGTLLSKISKVIIHGSVGQSSSPGSPPHLILGDFISSIEVGGVPALLKAGPRNDYRLPIATSAAGSALVLASERETP